MTEDVRYMKKEKTLLSAILLLALALLLFQLDAKSLWVDEVYTIKMAQYDFPSILYQTSHPPFHYLCLHFWTEVAGTSDFVQRALFVVFGLFSLIFVYLIGKNLFNRSTGLIATGLMAISPLFILYSRMSRYYSLALLLSLISTWLFLRLLEKRKTILWSGYILTSALMLYTVYTTIFVLAAQFIFALLSSKRSKEFLTRHLLSLVIIAILFSPWLLILLNRNGLSGDLGWPQFYTGLTAFILRIGYPFFCFSVGETIYYYNPIGVLGFLFIFSLFAFGLWKLRKDKEQFRSVSIFLFVPFVLFVLFGTLFNAYIICMNSKLMFCASFFYLGIASGLSKIKNARWKTVFLILIILISAYSLSNYYTNSEFHNPAFIRPTKECCEEVMKISHPGDVVISPHPPESYYLKKRNGRHLFSSNEKARDYIKENENQRVWLIFVVSPFTTEERAKDRDKFANFLLSQNYTLNYTKEYDPLKGHYHFVSPTFQYKEIIQGYEKERE